MNIKPIEVLEVENNNKIIQFKRDDIVEIDIGNPWDNDSCVVIGKILFIDLTSLELDCSTLYYSDVKTISYEDISSIKLYDEGEDN